MLNQDCLENFFGQIRQHRGRMTHPNSTQFTVSYKTLFLKQVCKGQTEGDRYNPAYLKCIEQICLIGNHMLNHQNINEQTISNIISYVNNYVKFSFQCQLVEKIGETLIKAISTLCITKFCKKVNNIIKGKEVPQHGILNGLVYNAAKLSNKRNH